MSDDPAQPILDLPALVLQWCGGVVTDGVAACALVFFAAMALLIVVRAISETGR